MKKEPYSVIIADNHPLCKAGMAALARSLGASDVATAEDAAHLRRALANHPEAKLIMLNLNLPGLARTEGIRRIRMDFPHVRVVVFSQEEDRSTVLEVVSSGVHGFVPKSFQEERMSQALSAVMNGQIYVPDVLAELATPPAATPLLKVVSSRSHKVELTERQVEVLTLLALGKSNKEIARSLSISEGTVKVHVNASFRALGVHNRVSAAAAIANLGLEQEHKQPSLPGMGMLERRGAKRPTSAPSQPRSDAA